MEKRNWDDYLNVEIDCNCGIKHRCNIDKIIVEEDAISKLSEYIMTGFYHNTCVVCDSTTEEAAGKLVYQELRNNLIQFEPIVLKEKEPLADEKTIGEVMVNIAPKCDLIIAVGAGTVNDICKLISYKMGIDYIIVATAPSMDGYVSEVVTLLVNQIKSVQEAARPKAIIADTNLISQAPESMIAAGVADVLGKYICLTDWKLANLITQEYHCDFVDALIRDSLELVRESVEKIGEKDKEAIGMLTEALILSGIAMGYIGSTRPAYGSEHELVYFWERNLLQENISFALHGTEIGVATVVILKLLEKVRESIQTIEELQELPFDEEVWKENIIRVYEERAGEVFELEEKLHKNSQEVVQQRREKMSEKKGEILSLLDKLPESEEISQLLKTLHAPYLPGQIHVGAQLLKDSLLYAKELRGIYGILQLLFDLNELEKFRVQDMNDFIESWL